MLEHAADLVVEVHRARQRIRLGPALEHLHAPAALTEQDREELAHRPVADDGDVDRVRHATFRIVSAWASSSFDTSSFAAGGRKKSTRVMPASLKARSFSPSGGAP